MSRAEVDFETGSQHLNGAGSRDSIGDRIKAAIAARDAAAAEVVILIHDAAPEFEITCRVPSDGEELAELVQRSEKRAKSNGTGSVWFNRLLIARYTSAIKYHGELLADDDGTARTFASRSVQELVDAPDAAQAVFRLYGSDAVISTLATELMDKAGFGNSAAVQVIDDPSIGR
jgi:hypothetical protein